MLLILTEFHFRNVFLIQLRYNTRLRVLLGFYISENAFCNEKINKMIIKSVSFKNTSKH